MVKKSIRSAFEIWSLKSHGIGSGRGPSPSELQTVSMAIRQLPVFHIACLFMANDQFQSSTTARSHLFKVAVFHNSSIIKIREIKNHSRAHSRVIFLKGAYLK
ncbi:hypothetical protein B6C83_07460 [Aerococcus urinae]|nr:hypothetical protein AWM73_08630 [Aerococcus urinae]ORE68503.1 hypothetical protein B6C83_07460 [Aerococcus urinae]